MLSCLDLRFWAIVVLAALVLRALPIRRSIGFGLWSCLAIGCLAGWQMALGALVLATLYWALLWCAVACQAPEADAPPSRGARQLGLAAITLPVGLLLVNKLGSDVPIVREWLSLHPSASGLHRLLAGLAFSYVFLRAVELAHAVIWKRLRLVDLASTVGYLFPLHMLLAGPVGRYEDHLRMNEPVEREDGWLVVLNGANQIATGLIYKYVLAEYWRIFFFGADSRLTSLGWIDTGLLFVYLFFDFAGYSRIMLGAGIWMGVPTPENFRSPFAATTITDFFARWHISLGTFIQRNLYMPLQMALVRRWGIRRAALAGLAAMFPAWLFVGAWHRLSVAFFVYGLTFAGIVWLEKQGRDRLLRQAWTRTPLATATTRVLGPVYVFVVVTTMLHLVISELMPT